MALYRRKRKNRSVMRLHAVVREHVARAAVLAKQDLANQARQHPRSTSGDGGQTTVLGPSYEVFTEPVLVTEHQTTVRLRGGGKRDQAAADVGGDDASAPKNVT